MMRIASNGGLGFWGASGAETNDTPQFSVSETVVSTAVPMYVKYAGISLFLGTAQDDKDGWIGTTTNQGVHLGANNKSVAYLGSDDNMYVGLTDDDMRTIRQELKNKYQLFVLVGVPFQKIMVYLLNPLGPILFLVRTTTFSEFQK